MIEGERESESERARVDVRLPGEVDPRATTVRLYTSTLSLVGEALAGVPFDVKPGLSLSANAFDDKGRIVAVSEPFVAAADGINLATLTAMPGIEAQSRDAPQSWVKPDVFGYEALDLDAATWDQYAADVWISYRATQGYRSRASKARRERKLPFAFEEDFVISYCRLQPRPPNLAAVGLLFPGPEGKQRLGLYPLRHIDGDRHDFLRVKWSDARSRGFSLPTFVFDEELLDRAISAIRYHNANLLSPLVDRAVIDVDGGFERGRPELAALLIALASIDDDSRWDQLNELSARLVERLPIPDAWILRAEILARLGWHKEAQASLRKIRYRQLPWTTAALKLLSQRLSYYDGQDMKGTWTIRKRWYQNLLGMAHPACVFCVLELARSPGLSQW